MRNIYSFTVAAVLSFMTFNSSAQTISAVDSTIDSAEKKISLLAQEEGKSYEILGASVKNRVYMTARLISDNPKETLLMK
ncbi:hypothetical protein B1H42_08280 [Enterobacter cloacae subsp. cloacae]|jgi:hypothetical protein|uniref:hypothetical protein n=1 Tax=Enterobacter TaxID=547 RepID=UPI0002E004CF|nr:hypothetical protein [Enterobacter cloacae]EKU2876774.1 hypothetical protein [Enterobacter cloacae]ELE9013125.1 hypothetical protein [Enterobacter cloacae]ELK7333100.1 hypothetical protein [Enterobacter cloacae]ELK7442583.1 hypothetical protein [Enterobacter cloacae]ELR9130438.1 hypothetical protein [Enterobacter cloacae]